LAVPAPVLLAAGEPAVGYDLNVERTAYTDRAPRGDGVVVGQGRRDLGRPRLP
jgi:hypothetical protein